MFSSSLVVDSRRLRNRDRWGSPLATYWCLGIHHTNYSLKITNNVGLDSAIELTRVHMVGSNLIDFVLVVFERARWRAGDIKIVVILYS